MPSNRAGHQSTWSTGLVRMMRSRTGRSRASELDSGPRWGISENRGFTSPTRSSTLPRTVGKKSRAPAPPPSQSGYSSGKVGRTVIATGMVTSHHPRRKFDIPCKGRSVLSLDDDEVHVSSLFGCFPFVGDHRFLLLSFRSSFR